MVDKCEIMYPKNACVLGSACVTWFKSSQNSPFLQINRRLDDKVRSCTNGEGMKLIKSEALGQERCVKKKVRCKNSSNIVRPPLIFEVFGWSLYP